MEKTLYELRTFHLTGKKIAPDFADLGKLDLVPALLNRYRDLTQLRYDYPLVLVEGDGECFVKSLTSIINGILQEIAPQGVEGERIRKNLLSQEHEIRQRTATDKGGTLSKLWEAAAGALVSDSDLSGEDKKKLEANLARAKRALRLDGELIQCNGAAASSLFVHAWRAIENERARGVLETIERLVIGLSGILRADELKSKQGLSADALKSAIGTSFQDEFDFSAMASGLSAYSRESHLPKKREERIRFALEVLESQRFFALRGSGAGKSAEGSGPYPFVVESCTEALQTYRKRVPAMVDLVKAVRIAELELANEYVEKKHDPVFEQFDEGALRRDDVAFFPSYLVCLDNGKYDDANKAALIEILSSDMPIKVLFQPEEILGGSSVRTDRHSSTGWEGQLANLAIGLGSAYVLQAPSSSASLMSDAIGDGLRYRGPALFNTFSGTSGTFPNLDSYLISASAAQSRAFPCFVYDPGAGEDWAARFRVDANPQVESAWPVDAFSYEDGELQAVSDELAFSLVDFAACDRRLAECFISVPPGKWHRDMVPAAEYLQLSEEEASAKVPYIWMVDGGNTLHRVVMTHNIVSAARECAKSWRNLQELGGIQNSHALALLERERQAWEAEKQKEIEELKKELQVEAGQVAAASAPALEPAAEAAEEVAEERGPIEVAGIDTPRCNSCDECVNKNPQMFAYNENKQAYIKDIDAGTFKDLVEAAEVCKVAIIHPGKPRNPDEPGLEELIKRAEPFN